MYLSWNNPSFKLYHFELPRGIFFLLKLLSAIIVSFFDCSKIVFGIPSGEVLLLQAETNVIST
jgi:hypothetical protein